MAYGVAPGHAHTASIDGDQAWRAVTRPHGTRPAIASRMSRFPPRRRGSGALDCCGTHRPADAQSIPRRAALPRRLRFPSMRPICPNRVALRIGAALRTLRAPLVAVDPRE